MAGALPGGIVAVLDHLWNAMKCKCQSSCNEVYTPTPSPMYIPMECSRSSGSNNAWSFTSYFPTMDATNFDHKTSTTYVREDIELIKNRNAVAQAYIQQGLTHKHAWWKAFQAHPRVRVDSQSSFDTPSSDSQSSQDLLP